MPQGVLNSVIPLFDWSRILPKSLANRFGDNVWWAVSLGRCPAKE